MFWFILAEILLFLVSLPFLRLFFKRIVMALKLSAAAKKAGGRLMIDPDALLLDARQKKEKYL